MSIRRLYLCLLALPLSLLWNTDLSGQQVIDSCFTSISVGTTFGSSVNIANRNADCLNWTGSTWLGDWNGANISLAPPGSTPGTRAIWMGDASVWTTGGEGFGMRLNAPIVSGVTYNFEFTRVSHGTGSAGSFTPTLYTNTTGTMGTIVGTIPAAGNSWFTGIVSFTATAANAGHVYIFFLSQGGAVGSGMFLACGNAVVLPMEIRQLDGWAEADAKQLTWEMHNETGYTTHVIERSLDGENFVDVGELTSSGSEGATVYSYADGAAEVLDLPQVMYRVRSLLADGAEAYSPVVEILRDGATDYLHQVYPNPINEGQTLFVEYVSASAQSGIVRLHDLMGREVYAEQTIIETGMNKLEIPAAKLGAGSYLLSLQTPHGKFSKRVVVTQP